MIKVPEGYALVGIDALKAWGKYEEVRNACQVSMAPQASVLPDEEHTRLNLLDRYGTQYHRMGELWERYQGKGWPEAESEEFTRLRDEVVPATRALLLASAPPAPQEPIDDNSHSDLEYSPEGPGVDGFAPQALPHELDVRTILLAIEPGADGMGEEVYAKSVADVEAKLTAMDQELEEWQLGIKRLPAPQASVVQQEPANVRCRWNIELDGDDLLVCFNEHDKGESCSYQRYVPAQQADKLVKCSYGDSGYACCEGVPCAADVHNNSVPASVVQQEPLGFISPKQVERIVDPDGEFGAYIPMRKTPAGNFTLAVYTHLAQQAKPLTNEQREAVFAAANGILEHGAPMSWEHALVDAVEAAHGITKGPQQ